MVIKVKETYKTATGAHEILKQQDEKLNMSSTWFAGTEMFGHTKTIIAYLQDASSSRVKNEEFAK